MGFEYRIEPHSVDTLKEHRLLNRALAAIPEAALSQVTHFIDSVQISQQAVGMYYATQESDHADRLIGDMVATSINVPAESRRIAARRRIREGGLLETPHQLRCLGVNPTLLQGHADPLELLVDSALVLTPIETAKSILFQHPEIASLNPEIAADMLDYYIENALKRHPELWQYISGHPAGTADSWERSGFACNTDGSPFDPPTDILDKDGKPIPWPKGPDGKPRIPQSELTDGVVKAAKLAVDHVLRATKDSARLHGVVWQRTQGIPATQDKQGVTIPRAALRSDTPGTAGEAPGAGAAAYKWTLANSGSSWGLDVNDSVAFDPATQQVTIRIRNKANRCMGAYAQFLDSSGAAITPSNWTSRLSTGGYEPNPTKKYLAFVRPVDCIFGIPANIFKSELSISFPFLENAVKTNVLLGGMGIGNSDPDVESLGRLTTAMLCYAVPGMMIAFGVGLDSTAWYFSLFTNPTVLELVLGIFHSDGGYWLKTMDTMLFLRKMAGAVPTIIFSKALARYVVKPIMVRWSGAQAAQAAPIAGWVLKVMSLTAAAGMLISTTVAANNAPGTYTLELSRAIDVKVNVHPDPIAGGPDAIWPLLFDHYELQLKNQSGATQSFGPGNRKDASSPIEHTFLNVPAGPSENIQITANLYAKNGWLCGQWVSDWVKASTTDGSTTLTIRGSIVARLVPLTTSTVYSHVKKLGFENGNHVWKETTTAPTEVWRTDGSAGSSDISKLVNITSNNHAYRVGYTWLASDMNLPLDFATDPTRVKMYTFQCISTLANPEKGGKRAERGFSVQPYLAFDQFGPEPAVTMPLSCQNALDNEQTAVTADIREAFSSAGRPLPEKVMKRVVTKTAEWFLGDANSNTWLYTVRRQPSGIAAYPYLTPAFSPRNFYLDPRGAADGKQFLRHVDLSDPSTKFDYTATKSWGVFHQSNLDAVIIHPRGYAIGVSYQNHKMEIIELPAEAKPDAQAPIAIPMSGQGAQEGLMNGPRAMTVTADGRVLVLEQTNARVQAFDTLGSPVQCFAGTLEFELDGGFAETLNQRVVSDALAAELQKHITPTIAPRAYFGEEDVDDLNAGEFTRNMMRAMTRKGITLAAASSVTTVASGSIWTVKDPETELTFDLRFDGIEVPVRSSAAWSVELQSRNKRWIIRDATSVQTFRIVKDDATGKLKARQLIATMGLKDPNDNAEYLDIACEPEGFIYVLSYLRPGSTASNYRLDIYNPDGTHLARTPKNANEPGVNAAKITVDHWRTLLTLNYEKIQGPGGRPEPSISQWAPSPPPPGSETD